MKPSQDGRTVLKVGISKFKTILLCVLLTELITPQIPFKGFCKFNSLKIDSGYTNVFSFNYNQNEYADLLVYNPFSNQAKLLDGVAGNLFSIKKNISLPFEISNIEPLVIGNKLIETYAVTSRKNRCFGIIKFSKEGKPSTISQIKFDSYPQNLSISDYNADGNLDFLISGNSFNGLSIVVQDKNHLNERKIVEKTVFKFAKFIDFNADGAEDIIALNSFDSKLHFFFNDTRGDFRDLRQVDLDGDILSFHVFDMNYDSYEDIILSISNSIIIFFGDPTADYNKSIKINTSFQADEFTYGDYNRDGFFDINYIDKQKGYISTIFAKDFDSFYPEMIHKKTEGLCDVIPFFSKFVYGTAYLTKDGELHILSKVSSMTDDLQLAVAIESDLITSFDYMNNGISDIAFTDRFDGKIKFILRDAAGLPDKLFSIKLYDEVKSLIAFSNSKIVKTFFLLGVNNRLIESIEVNFEEFSFKRNQLYSKGLIQDLLVMQDSKNDPQLFILYANNKNLNLEILTEYQSKFISSYYEGLTSNWSNPFFTLSGNLNIGYWQSDQKNLSLKFLSVKDDKFQPITKIEMKKNVKTIISKSNQDYNNSDLGYVSIINADDGLYLFNGEKSVGVFTNNGSLSDLRITNKNQLFFGKNNSIFVYDQNSKSISEIRMLKYKKEFVKKKLLSNIYLNCYIVSDLDQRNNHLIFTDSKLGNIGIRQLSK